MKSRKTLNATLFATIVVVTSLFTPLAHAQGGQGVIANIPFEFSVGSLHFEGGSYEFNLASDRFGMSVVNLKTGKKRYVTVSPHDKSLSPESDSLVFIRTGGNQYLSEVHFSGAIGYSRLNVSHKSNVRDQNTILQGALRK